MKDRLLEPGGSEVCGRLVEVEYQPLRGFKKFFAVIFFFEEVLFLFLLLIVLEMGCFDDALPLLVLGVVFALVFVAFLSGFSVEVVEDCGGVSEVGFVLFCFCSESLLHTNRGLRSSYKSAMLKYKHFLKKKERKQMKKFKLRGFSKYCVILVCSLLRSVNEKKRENCHVRFLHDHSHHPSC